MTQTTFVNGRGIAHAGSGGMSLAFPDVCLTPILVPVPLPYPNLGRSADATGGPATVTVDGAMPMVKGATYARSTGDEPGVVGGVLSGRFIGPCEFMMYSFDVQFEGRNVCRLGDPMFHNARNTVA